MRRLRQTVEEYRRSSAYIERLGVPKARNSERRAQAGKHFRRDAVPFIPQYHDAARRQTCLMQTFALHHRP